ncbi:MAG: hypothetical protein ACRD1R_08225, partial [Acidobacteriota bacterium]
VSSKRVLLASLCGLIASLSFGPGFAAFIGLGVILLLRRHYAGVVIVTFMLLTALVLQQVLPVGQVVRAALVFRPFDNANTAVTWLASVWNHLLAPFRETSVGQANVWPFTILGWVGVVWLSLTTLRAWRSSNLGAARLLGLGIAWFALAVALLGPR